MSVILLTPLTGLPLGVNFKGCEIWKVSLLKKKLQNLKVTQQNLKFIEFVKFEFTNVQEESEIYPTLYESYPILPHFQELFKELKAVCEFHALGG